MSYLTGGGRTIETCSSRGDRVLYKEVDPALGLTVAEQDTINQVQTTSLVITFNIIDHSLSWQ